MIQITHNLNGPHMLYACDTNKGKYKNTRGMELHMYMRVKCNPCVY